MTTLSTLLFFGAVAAGTFLTRIAPFLLFPDRRTPPRYVVYLGEVLPTAIMGMLVVYCLKGVNPAVYPHGFPELIALLCITVLHLWRKNTLLSIGGGTVIYLLLTRLVF